MYCLRLSKRKQRIILVLEDGFLGLKMRCTKQMTCLTLCPLEPCGKKVTLGNRFKKEVTIFFSRSNQVVFTFKIAHKVKELREKLDDIAKDINQFGLLSETKLHGPGPINVKCIAQHSYIAEDEVIGREKEKKELLKLLLADAIVEERVSVIALVGIGGQGKTALAQLLYNAKETRNFFEVCLWACINDFSDLKEALEEITGTKANSVDELQKRLREKIHRKKFLLVIDDVWDDIREQWLCLKRLLDVGERGSKIVMTTRSEKVAQNLATSRSHYALEELSDKDAWILFKRMAFDRYNDVKNQTKEELGRLIIKVCPKVPLAIRTIGSFLYNKDNKVWLEFVNGDLMKAMPDHENIVMRVLKISYDDLPLSVKHCFAYCSLFPKDYQFDKATLIHLWMANGFLDTPVDNPCLEDVGESYFLYMVQRCFFQDLYVDYNDDIISGKMHDLFHDLAVQITANECLSMLKNTEDLGIKLPRHLLVMDITSSVLECKGLRSLLSPNAGFVDRVLLDGVFLKLKSLRTLSLRQLNIEEIPSSIGKLVHLRYLDLTSSKRLSRLPDALCKLQNLIILSLEGCENLIKLPDDLQKLISLRYLNVKKCLRMTHMPSGLKEMTSLVRLDQLIVHKENGGLRYLKHLNNLTGGIRIKLPRGGWENCIADAEDSMLTKKTKLSKLYLWWSNTEGEDQLDEPDVGYLYKLQPPNNISYLDVCCYPGVNFPCWISSLHNLVNLNLVNSKRCRELPQLRHLCQLKKLTLLSMPLVEYVENDMCYDGKLFFPSLQTLDISDMDGLKRMV